MKKILIVLLCFVFIYGSLFLQSNPKNVDGVYVGNGRFRDSIYIYTNGNYIHHFIDSSGKLYSNNGKWSYDYNTINFENFIGYDSFFFVKTNVPVYWTAAVDVSFFGKVSLIVNEDLDLHYLKVK